MDEPDLLKILVLFAKHCFDAMNHQNTKEDALLYAVDAFSMIKKLGCKYTPRYLNRV